MEKTVPQVSAETGILQRTLAKAAKQGRLPARKLGRDWLIDVDDPQFKQFLEDNQKWHDVREQGQGTQ